MSEKHRYKKEFDQPFNNFKENKHDFFYRLPNTGILCHKTLSYSSNRTRKQKDSAPLPYQSSDHSKVRSLRSSFVDRINSVKGNTKDSESLLRDYAKPESGGILYAVGKEDIYTMNPDTMRRIDRISQLYKAENANVENRKSKMITEGRAMGQSAQDILNDIVSLYDSQSELFKLGKGWDGDVFAFDSASPEGFARTIRYHT
jgi:hypothetical protein